MSLNERISKQKSDMKSLLACHAREQDDMAKRISKSKVAVGCVSCSTWDVELEACASCKSGICATCLFNKQCMPKPVFICMPKPVAPVNERRNWETKYPVDDFLRYSQTKNPFDSAYVPIT